MILCSFLLAESDGLVVLQYVWLKSIFSFILPESPLSIGVSGLIMGGGGTPAYLQTPINVEPKPIEIRYMESSYKYSQSFYFRATLGVKEVLQSSKFSTSIFFIIFHSTSLPESKNVF